MFLIFTSLGFFGVREQELAGLSVASAIAEVFEIAFEMFMSETTRKIFVLSSASAHCSLAHRGHSSRNEFRF